MKSTRKFTLSSRGTCYRSRSRVAICQRGLRDWYVVPVDVRVLWVSVSTKPVRGWDEIKYRSGAIFRRRDDRQVPQGQGIDVTAKMWLAKLSCNGISPARGTPFWVKVEYEEPTA